MGLRKKNNTRYRKKRIRRSDGKMTTVYVLKNKTSNNIIDVCISKSLFVLDCGRTELTTWIQNLPKFSHKTQSRPQLFKSEVKAIDRPKP